MTVERNIHLLSGKYRVLITRRPKNIYGGRFTQLLEAREVRNRLEALFRKGSPSHRSKQRKTYLEIRAERKAKRLCIYCGDSSPRPNQVGCEQCYTINALKRREARRVK